jgi:hypothetical protein
MDTEGHGGGLAPLRTEPALPPGALAALESAMAANGGGRGPRSLARRLGTLTSVLVLAVAAAAGFIGGVQVQKRQGDTSSVSAAGAGARTAGATSTTVAGGPGPAGGPSSTVAGGAGGAGAARGPAGGGAARAGGAGAAGAAVAGQVKLVDGNNLYVTDAQGNVVKVVTTPASRFTRTGSGTIQDVRPGDTVVVQGQKGDDGIVTATAVADSGPPGGS